MTGTKKKTMRKPSAEQQYRAAVIKLADELPHLTEAIADLTNELSTFLQLAQAEIKEARDAG